MRKEKENRVIDNQFDRIHPLWYTVSLSMNQAPAGSNDFINIMNFINFQLN